MENINKILTSMQKVVANPAQVVRDWKESGKKVIGCFPVYCPDEIVHAAGMMPIGMWGADKRKLPKLLQLCRHFAALLCNRISSWP